MKDIHVDRLSPSCHIKFNQKRFGIKTFAVYIQWIHTLDTLMIYLLQMYSMKTYLWVVLFSFQD